MVRGVVRTTQRKVLMETAQRYDAIVIGSGQAGTPLSRTLAEAGLKTALIEREHVGGSCVNEGCTPTKTMVASGRVAYLARRAADYGVQTGAITIDLGRVRQRKRDIVNSFRKSSQSRLEKTANLELLFGQASFTGPRSLEVRLRDGGERMLSADRIFIDTGTRPSRPPLEGLDEVHFLDNVSIMELDQVPRAPRHSRRWIPKRLGMPNGIRSSQPPRRTVLARRNPFRIDSDKLPNPELVGLILGDSLQAAVTAPRDSERIRA
jgi:pyridine nucleotide-disulfide oxidoreductase